MELIKSFEMVLLSYWRRSILKSSMRKISYLLQSILEIVDSTYTKNFLGSVFGCL